MYKKNKEKKMGRLQLSQRLAQRPEELKPKPVVGKPRRAKLTRVSLISTGGAPKNMSEDGLEKQGISRKSI